MPIPTKRPIKELVGPVLGICMNAGEMQNGINVCKHGDLRICCLSQQVPCGREDDIEFLLNQLIPQMAG